MPSQATATIRVMKKLLVANIGSTSFKFRLFEMPSERLLAKGGMQKIGAGRAPYTIEVEGRPKIEGEGEFRDYASAVAVVEEVLAATPVGGFDEVVAFGFKPVMARGVSGTQVLDERVLGAMEEMNALFPAHNPPYIAAVREFNRLYPEIPCIGTFETAFYDDLPEHNQLFPVPFEWVEKYGVRRFGFHGASHRYVTERAAELAGRSNLRMISCHLGGSSSIAAVVNGKAVNSSWGMTAQSGLPQNNRVGDFDTFALIHLLRNCGMSLDEAEAALSKESGLKGLAGTPTGDIRDLKEAVASGNHRAKVALDLFVSAIRKFIGQFLVEMNGADILIFTAGIAENNPDLREAICADMDFCGLKLDAAANASARATETVLSAPDSKIEVRLIPTNEEIVIARNAYSLLENSLSNS